MASELNYDPVVRVLAAISTVLLAIILIWAIIASSGPTLDERLRALEDRIVFIACISLVDHDDRTEAAIVACQSSPEGTG